MGPANNLVQLPIQQERVGKPQEEVATVVLSIYRSVRVTAMLSARIIHHRILELGGGQELGSELEVPSSYRRSRP